MAGIFFALYFCFYKPYSNQGAIIIAFHVSGIAML